MAVSKDDVRHIAGLARIGVPDSRLDQLVTELNGILAHMEVLQKVESIGASASAEAPALSTFCSSSIWARMPFSSTTS